MPRAPFTSTRQTAQIHIMPKIRQLDCPCKRIGSKTAHIREIRLLFAAGQKAQRFYHMLRNSRSAQIVRRIVGVLHHIMQQRGGKTVFRLHFPRNGKRMQKIRRAREIKLSVMRIHRKLQRTHNHTACFLRHKNLLLAMIKDKSPLPAHKPRADSSAHLQRRYFPAWRKRLRKLPEAFARF